MATVLQTTFDCNGSPATVAIARNAGESIADHSTRFKAAVARAQANCDSVTLSLGGLQSSWTSAQGATICANEDSYGEEQHDADVILYKVEIPPI